MSRHWDPDEELARTLERRERRSWPAGATAGLMLVTAVCFGVAAVLYHVAGPRDAFQTEAD